jgi:hypothetical protein
MTVAAKTAMGMFSNTGVKNSNTIKTTAAVTTLARPVWAPVSSLAAD